MKALRLVDAASRLFVEEETAEPLLRSGEVLIRVYAAGVIPTELQWYPTLHTKDGKPRTGAVLTHEFSGAIAKTAGDVTGLSIGDEVYGMNDWFADGALAEYCATQPDWIAPKPRRVSYAEAASVPISALTAWQGLFVRAKLRSGERVLIHGGAGSVGSFAVQLAHAQGAYVLTTASARNAAFVKELGANEVIDYQRVRFEEAARDIDVVFDSVGGETLARSWGVLKPGGRLVTIAAEGEAAREERVKDAFFIMEPDRQQLFEVARRIDAGELRPVVDTVVPFSRAPEVYTGSVAKHGRGKLVVLV